MIFKSINPYNNEVVGTYESISDQALNDKLDLSKSAFEQWRKVSFEERKRLMIRAGEILRENVEEYARMIS